MFCDITLPKGTLETGQQNVWPLFQRVGTQLLDSSAASIATGWSEPVPGRELHPLKSNAFHGALLCQQSRCGSNSSRM
jgi:hypothetical protein